MNPDIVAIVSPGALDPTKWTTIRAGQAILGFPTAVAAMRNAETRLGPLRWTEPEPRVFHGHRLEDEQ